MKRCFDLFLSVFGILILLPIFILISLLVKATSKGPILFKQVRMGKGEKEFIIYKFRTMTVNAEKNGRLITVGMDPRITTLGHILRKYKLDELPQLINVLKGDMSFVGPRPEVSKYTELYTTEQKNVFKVRPGITDYASIKYRNESGILANSSDPEKTYIEEVMIDKLKLNLEYIKNRSFWGDINIIFETLLRILKVSEENDESIHVRLNNSVSNIKK